MSITFTNVSHRLSIRADNGRNPVLGRAEPVFNDDIEYFEGELLETERDCRTGKILEMIILDITKVKYVCEDNE